MMVPPRILVVTTMIKVRDPVVPGGAQALRFPSPDSAGVRMIRRSGFPQPGFQYSVTGAPRVLLVDLNNFARFPTLPVGLIAAVLRKADHEVEVLSPLAVGVKGIPRAARAKPWGLWDARWRWWSATTPSRAVRATRQALGHMRAHERSSRGHKLMDAVGAALDRRPDVVLVSAYLMYHESVQRMCALAEERGIPVVLGGPAFHNAATRREWLRIPGLTAVFAGEAEGAIARVIASVLGGDQAVIPGLTRAGEPDGGLAPPLTELDLLPFPDYDDFPWERYPNRIVSMLTARGCGWGQCRFCSDVVTVAGRGFRSRSLESVTAELAYHHERHDTALFCFSDLKLNSKLDLWRGLHEHFQREVPGAKWTCAVHVGSRADEGLSAADLLAARRAGLVRVTTGLETGSQSLLNTMKKGTTPERVEDFLAAAHAAGISTRVTAFTGYPGETPADIEETTRLLERVGPHLDRVHLTRLLLHNGTPLERDLEAGRLSGTSLWSLESQPLRAETWHVNAAVNDPRRRTAIRGLLGTVHGINRKPLRTDARELEGAM